LAAYPVFAPAEKPEVTERNVGKMWKKGSHVP
jgi:hypothetical protein